MDHSPLPPPTDAYVDAYFEKIIDLGVAMAEFYYDSPDVRFPPAIQEQLAALDKLTYNPHRPMAMVDPEAETRTAPGDLIDG